MYFLDTNTCIYFLNGKYPAIRDRMLMIPPRQIKIPSPVKAELLLGAYKSQTRERTTEKVLAFLKPFEVIPFTDAMTKEYADIRAEQETSGTPIGANDYFTAAIARNMNGTLITHNTDESSRISRLQIEDWTV